MPVDPRPDPVRLVILVTLAVSALGLYRFASPDHAIDDAWISFRIARTALQTGHLTYDATQPPVEGMTNLLWTVLSMLWVGLPVDPIGPARCLGAVFHLATVAMLTRSAADVAARLGGSAVPAACVTGVLLATSGTLAFNAMSGLETSLYGLLLALAFGCALAGQCATAGVCLGLLAATRPEGVLVGGLAVGILLAGGPGRGAALRMVVPFGLLVGGVEVFRFGYYGAFVPNTYYAKPPDLHQGLAYVAGALAWGTGAIGLTGILPVARRSRAAMVTAACMGLLVAGTAWSGGDWMPGARRLTDVLLAGATLTGVSAGLLAGAGGRQLALFSLPILAWVGGNVLSAMLGHDSASYEHEDMARLGQAVADNPQIRTVALSDIGRFGWTFPRSIYDLDGLTDAHIGRMAGKRGEKSWDEAYFRARAVDLVLLPCESLVTDPLTTPLSVEVGNTPLLLSILDHGGYRYHGEVGLSPGHWLLVFGRDGLALDPSTFGPESKRDLRDILADAAR